MTQKGEPQPMNRLGSLVLSALALIMLHTGCSNNPVSTSDEPATRFADTNPANDVAFTGQIATIERSSRVLTLSGRPTPVTVESGAALLAEAGDRIGIDDLQVGDLIDIKGDLLSSGVVAEEVTRRSGRGSSDDSSEVEYAGHVIFVDPAANSFALNSCWLVRIAPGAEVVRKANGIETPITINDIKLGDSVEVRGALQEDFSLLADRVRVRIDGDDDDDDDEVTAAITEIDYVNETFRLFGRAELFTTNAATVIVGKVRNHHADDSSSDDDNGSDDDSTRFEPIPFTDLLAGDTVEVHFTLLDSETALAGRIEVEDGILDDDEADDDDMNEEVEFTSTIASIDLNTRLVGFTSGRDVGTVVDNARLTDDDDNLIPLDAFLVGQLVEAKGYIDSTGTFLIVRMEIEDEND